MAEDANCRDSKSVEHSKKTTKYTKQPEAFTIVELLVVIVVIGVLATIITVSYLGVTKKAGAVAIQADLDNASKRIKLYQAANDKYPIAIDCSATPAANTICVKASNGNVLSYMVSNTNPPSFRINEGSTSAGIYYTATDSKSPYLSGIPGGLTPAPTVNTGKSIMLGIAISPDGTSAYITSYQSNDISMFSRNVNTGVLTALATPTIAAGYHTEDITVSADGASVYATNVSDNTVSMYARDTTTGALTALDIIATQEAPTSIVVSADDRSVYVANGNSSTISMYSRNTTTGALTALAAPTIATDQSPLEIIISPDGTSVYTVGYSNTVSMFSRDASTGALAALATPTIATGGDTPRGIAVSPDGTSVYVTNSNSSTVSMYSRDTSTGALTALATPTIATTDCPYGIVISPDGAFAYTTNTSNNGSGKGSVSVYNRNTSTGALTAATIPIIDSVSSPDEIIMSNDGDSVYVISFDEVSVYSRN